MLKIIVCDDDKTYLAEVTDMLKHFFGNQGIEADISGCISVEELMQCCTEKDKPDLCFLDIEMGDENGIDAAKAFNILCPSCDIAFLTNYISYATDAYETDHFYYVLKEEFPKRLDRIMKRYYKENTHFIVRSGRKEWHFDERDILFLERGRRTCTIKTIGGNLEKMPVPFEQVIERLEGPDFLRCHNSFMINFRNMSSYQKDSFVMNDGTVIPISRRYRNICLERFLKWQEVWI